MKMFVPLLAIALILSPAGSQAKDLSRFLGTWTGSRTYNFPDLKGTETFTMKVSRFKGSGLKYDVTIKRPGWGRLYHREFLYPGGDLIGVHGKIGGSVYDVRSGRWKISGKKLISDWYMYFSELGERQKNKTTWSIDSRGRLQELRTVSGGRVTATAKKR